MTRAPKKKPLTRREIEKELTALLASRVGDLELRRAIEALAKNEIAFNGATHIFGPALYRRNRVLFRPFILAHLSAFSIGERSFEAIAWRGEIGARLDAWLSDVDAADDVELFASLYAWKLRDAGADREKIWRAELLRRWQAPPTRAARQIVLAKMNQPYRLDEPTAIELYERDPDCARAFLLRHVPVRFWFAPKDQDLFRTLVERAGERGDHDFALSIFRRQASLDQWRARALEIAESAPDAVTLDRELEERHPESWGLNLGPTYHELLERRGRAALPYVMRHLDAVVGRTVFDRNGFKRLLALAEQKRWLDLWGALLRVSAHRAEYEEEIVELVKDGRRPVDETLERLRILAGVSMEWNLGPIGIAGVKMLGEDTAIALYRRFPDLVRGPFRLHVQPSWHSAYPKLLDEVIAAEDAQMVDFLASRLITRDLSFTWLGGTFKGAIERLAAYYHGRLEDPARFAERAVRVLGQVPAYSIFSYDRLVRSNRLARLFFERSASTFLGDPRWLRDLLESPQIHVQALAFRALALDDERARRAATDDLDLLIPTLLRPLHRRTRILALRALENAAASESDAARIVARARQAMDLPDKKYPKEQLLGLIARLLHRWPSLAAAEEQPVVHRHPARRRVLA